MRDWSKYKLESIVGGKNPDNTLILEDLLKDYAKVFNKKLNTLQPSCPKCIKRYYKELIMKINDKKNNSEYKLKAKFNGIPLKFGSQVLVTNSNITNDYAKIIISRFLDIYENKNEDFSPSKLFSEYPDDWEKDHFEEDVNEEDASKEDVSKEDVNEEDVNEEDVNEEDNETQEVIINLEELERMTLKELRVKFPDVKSTSKDGFIEKIIDTYL